MEDTSPRFTGHKAGRGKAGLGRLFRSHPCHGSVEVLLDRP